MPWYRQETQRWDCVTECRRSRSEMDPTLTVLTFSALAAAGGGLGAIPLIGRDEVPATWIGWASALASGLMLGAAYVLSTAETSGSPLAAAAGAVLGIGFIYATHAAAGTAELDLNRLSDPDPTYGYRILLVGSLHAASEGVAIGVAMALDIPFGIFMALAIAVHNMPEGLILAAVLKSRGVRQREAVGLAVVTNVGQVLLAVVTFAVVSAAPAMLPWTVGFAVGGLVYLVLLELLPESYRTVGATSIALLALVATGVVVLLQGTL